MATKKTSAIDDKKTQKGKKSPPSENNWGAFFASLITNFIFILLIYIIGSNFIYLSDTKYDGLKYLFPDEIDNYLTPPKYSGGGLTLPADEATIKKLSIIGIPGDKEIGHTFPYKGYADLDAGHIFSNFSRWFKYTIATSFATNRSLLIKYLTVCNNIFNRPLLMFIIAPLTLMITFIALIPGFCVPIWAAFTCPNYGWAWALIGLFFGYTMLISSAVAALQYIQLLFTLLILPLYIDAGAVRNILGEYILPFLLIFGVLTCFAAFANLDLIISITMTCIFILYIFFHFRAARAINTNS